MIFYPIENIINTCQVPTINFLDDWHLLNKWSLDTKKVFTHFFITEMSRLLDTVDYFVFTEIPKCLEFFEIFEYSKFSVFFEKFIRKLKKMLNNRIIIITPMVYPHCIESEEELSFWYGEFYDEYVVQTNRQIPDNIKQFKKFLNKYSLIELQKTFNVRKLIT